MQSSFKHDRLQHKNPDSPALILANPADFGARV
jgi:hypothetical protein